MTTGNNFLSADTVAVCVLAGAGLTVLVVLVVVMLVRGPARPRG
jgi:hypothetical protein